VTFAWPEPVRKQRGLIQNENYKRRRLRLLDDGMVVARHTVFARLLAYIENTREKGRRGEAG
jgi:hypothetical protein